MVWMICRLYIELNLLWSRHLASVYLYVKRVIGQVYLSLKRRSLAETCVPVNWTDRKHASKLHFFVPKTDSRSKNILRLSVPCVSPPSEDRYILGKIDEGTCLLMQPFNQIHLLWNIHSENEKLSSNHFWYWTTGWPKKNNTETKPNWYRH